MNQGADRIGTRCHLLSFFFQAEDGIRDKPVTGVQTCALPILIRPASAGALTQGRGLAVVEAANGVKVAVLNVLGALFLDTPVSPWEVIDELVDDARSQAPVVVLDF